jgi:hypothetical protein
MREMHPSWCCLMPVSLDISHLLCRSDSECDCELGQDILAGEKPKEGYYKDSAQYLNAGEKAAYEGGEGSGTLAFLTRGMSNI